MSYIQARKYIEVPEQYTLEYIVTKALDKKGLREQELISQKVNRCILPNCTKTDPTLNLYLDPYDFVLDP
jgi:lipopolysaccharide export system protein LptC